MAFLVCYLAMPSIIRIALRRGIVDAPSERKAHKQVTPSFGGVGIFLSCVLISLLFIPSENMDQIRYVFAALTIIFLVGARDDLDPLTPAAKLFGQLLGVALIIFCAEIKLTNLHGLFGIYDLPEMVSILITTVVFIFLINSFNLIDGIDALCGSISILVLSVIGTWFFFMGEAAFAILAITTAGATLAFLKYNISPSKIFMGDTGSLVLGTMCTVLVIQFLEVEASAVIPSFVSASTIAIGLFILPAFDTTRVFVQRLLNGKSPFQPDKNHIHHLLLELGLSHMQSTSLLLVVNTGFLMLAIRLQEMSPTTFLLISMGIAVCLTQCLHLSIYLKGRDVLRTEP